MTIAPHATPVAAAADHDLIRPHVDRLRCPETGQALRLDGAELITVDGRHRHRVTDAGVPLLAPELLRPESRAQKAHYDRIAGIYTDSLDLPHTRAYSAYLDRVLLKSIPPGPLGYIGELCCGRGEAIRLLSARDGDRPVGGVGIDISPRMLEAASRDHPGTPWLFVQGDATMLPLADEVFDNVFVLGGIHHVNDRDRLFAEVLRVLKPGGRFFWREPLDDLFAWRWMRAAVYRLSPTLDPSTERPLRSRETTRQLERAGLELLRWRTCGFVGFCILMNSDVLVLNRLLRHVPGISSLTRLWARIDDSIVRLPGLRQAGLQVVGVARKNARAS
ncbi:MAG: class I SAM-dependent methyltransferase [Planctomycetota bacterium]|jgi:ubiquinone/menaquinone biosynthesis C-methylase UbiE